MALWRTTAFICLQWALQYAVCREVNLPSGPLYRVAGFPLSLPCAVSGYEGARTQDFEWFLYREDAGGRQIGVISTRDRGFPYAPFQSRVRSGEVRVERDSGDRARLVVQRLRPEDQGRYECYTPSTDSRYQGNYSASVIVKVIADTLQISHSRSLSGPPLTEGSELQLTCSAAVQSKQHTHLSVTFGVRGGGAGTGAGPGAAGGGQGHNLREVISIGRELGVAPGRNGDYEKRYRDGEISLEKRRGSAEGDRDLYVMKMAAVAPGDAGSYFCEAAQWILDPEGGWERIAQRTMELGNLTVQPLADTLTVTTTPQGEVILQAGNPLSLTCEVGGVGAWARSALLVQWMRRGAAGDGGVGAEVEVARLGPDGVVGWGDDTSRGRGGSMEKEAEGRYSLRLFSTHAADSGVYRCAVSVFAGRRDPGPSSPATITQRSDGVIVNLKTKEVRVSTVAELSRGPLLKRGNTVSLLCNVSVATTGPSRVEVQWLMRREAPKGTEEEEEEEVEVEMNGRKRLAALTYDGLSRSYSNGSDVSVERLAPGCYRLRIHAATPEDQGHYLCLAEVWGQDPHGGWYNTGARAESASVHVYLYARATDQLLIPLVVGVSSALFVGVVIIATVTCCFMNRLARQRSQK
ncbi:hypothetical protein AAFF_G00391160 [Aldrovandia affinis]|uniref:Ig-like domain-containing protein n=1 Tax=Aldrovandia affinis TaxID=143900 RepID=A0AAD7SEE9_9TELE|nr:hypothetical protein AAFF_G00391160 [Aldrovandia affinis]